MTNISKEYDEIDVKSNLILKQKTQKISVTGKIHINSTGIFLRVTCISILIIIASINTYIGYLVKSIPIIFSTIILIHPILIMMIGWIYFRNPPSGTLGNELVSIIIPVYNQENMIRPVIDSIFKSSYKNLEVIAINDGSTDDTIKILNDLSIKYKKLNIIHKKNGGKRKAVGDGFKASHGQYIVFIDSDSIITEFTVEEMMKIFKGDPKIGGISGQVKLWNSNTNFLTKMQDVWYDSSYNISRTTESVFETVICCPGCIAGYRREALKEFIDTNWIDSNENINSENQQKCLVNNNIDGFSNEMKNKNNCVKKHVLTLSGLSKKLLKSSSKYDDSDDRTLTGQMLLEWKSVYAPLAISYTQAPDTFKEFFNQMLRWKKGYIRTSLFLSSFLWKKKINPIMIILYYIETLIAFTNPLIILIIFFFEPMINHNIITPVLIIFGLTISGFTSGLDYKIRNKDTKHWKYQVPMTLIQIFMVSWLLVLAIFTLKKDKWLTR